MSDGAFVSPRKLCCMTSFFAALRKNTMENVEGDLISEEIHWKVQKKHLNYFVISGLDKNIKCFAANSYTTPISRSLTSVRCHLSDVMSGNEFKSLRI